MIWKCNHGEERLGTRSAQVWRGIITDFDKEARSQLTSEKCSWLRVHGTFLLVSHQRTSLAFGWLYSQSLFLCALRPDDLGNQAARILEMSLQQPDQSHTHEESDYLVTLAQEFCNSHQVLFARGLFPRDCLRANEFT